MEVKFDPELQERLARAAKKQGRNSEALVVEAVERLLSDDDWFIVEVEKGIAAADRGELIEHEEVRKIVDRRYPD